MAHHKERNELQQLRFVLRKDAFFEAREKAVVEDIASLICAKQVSFVLMEVDEPFLQVGEELHKE